MFRNFGSILVCVVVVLAPLPFGSAEPFWGGVWCALLGLALLVAAPPIDDASHRTAIQLILVAVAAWCLIVVLQYTSAGSLFPPGPGWDQAGHLVTVAPRVAAYSQIPIVAVVPPLALILALLAGLVFGGDPTFTPRIYNWVAIAGLVYAGYGIFAELTNPTMLLWRQKTFYLDSVTGTFVNHNTAATFFGSIAIIWYLRSLREIRRRFDLTRWNDLGYVFRKLQNLETIQTGYITAFLALLATMFMTRSRAGSLLTMGVLGIVTMLYFNHMIKGARRVLIGAIALMVLGAVAVELAGGQLTTEIETRGLYDVARADAWHSELKIVRDYPWLGTGLGTFSSVFPAYRTPASGVWGVFDRAHSTPIELLVEMGIPFSIFVFVLWIVMLWFLLRASVRLTGGRLYVIAGTGIVTLGTLHSTVDFSLQIPGFSIVCCTLAGASLAQALLPLKKLDADTEGSLGKNAYRRHNKELRKGDAEVIVSRIPPTIGATDAVKNGN
jgi:O-antigen ligase